jgi:hypothetical protein
VATGTAENTVSSASALRQCPFCGVPVSKIAKQCPVCREVIGATAAPAARAVATPARRGFVRRGLLYMLMAGVLYYFSAGYSALPLPVLVTSAVTAILVPLLFLGGLGLTIFGIWRG